MKITIRRLKSEDAEGYRHLRLEALSTDPDSFISTFKFEQQKPIEYFRSELNYTHQPPIWGYHGIFVDEKLAGYCQISSGYLPKKKHAAQLYNLYIHPDYRQQGLGGQLIKHLLQSMKSAQIELVTASHLADNHSAAKFYQSLGFKEFGRRPDGVKDGERYVDEILIYQKL